MVRLEERFFVHGTARRFRERRKWSGEEDN